MIQKLFRRSRVVRQFFQSGRGLLGKLAMATVGAIRGRGLRPEQLIVRATGNLLRDFPVKPSVLNGLKTRIDLCDFSQVVILDEIMVERVYDLARVEFTPESVVDCGAYHGWFTLLAASRFPFAHFIAIEPDPAHFAALWRNAAFNRLEVQLENAAVSDQDGEAAFSFGQGCGSSLLTFQASGASNIIQVRTIGLPRLLQSLVTDNLLLKIDIEGAEEQLLAKITPMLPQNCAVFLETHGGEMAWNKASGLLIADGFRASTIRDRGRFVDGFAIRVTR